MVLHVVLKLPQISRIATLAWSGDGLWNFAFVIEVITYSINFVFRYHYKILTLWKHANSVSDTSQGVFESVRVLYCSRFSKYNGIQLSEFKRS